MSVAVREFDLPEHSRGYIPESLYVEAFADDHDMDPANNGYDLKIL